MRKAVRFILILVFSLSIGTVSFANNVSQSQKSPESARPLIRASTVASARAIPTNNLDNVDLWNFWLSETGSLSQAEVAYLNEYTLQGMALETVLEDQSNQIAAADMDLVSKMQNSIANHPIVGNEGTKRYDTEGVIGFCFGRALYAHLLSIYMGLKKESVRKVYLVGPQEGAGFDWSYHVATAVYTKNGWYVLDNVAGEARPLRGWFDFHMASSIDKRARLYVAKAEKFGAFNEEGYRGTYTPGDLGLFLDRESDNYLHYFKDLMSWFSTAGMTKFRSLGLPTPEEVRAKAGKTARPGSCKRIFS